MSPLRLSLPAALLVVACSTPSAIVPYGSLSLLEADVISGRGSESSLDDPWDVTWAYYRLGLCDTDIRQAISSWAERFGLTVEKNAAQRSGDGVFGQALLWSIEEHGWFELRYVYAVDRHTASLSLSFRPKKKRRLDPTYASDLRRMYNLKPLADDLRKAVGCKGQAK